MCVAMCTQDMDSWSFTKEFILYAKEHFQITLNTVGHRTKQNNFVLQQFTYIICGYNHVIALQLIKVFSFFNLKTTDYSQYAEQESS